MSAIKLNGIYQNTRHIIQYSQGIHLEEKLIDLVTCAWESAYQTYVSIAYSLIISRCLEKMLSNFNQFLICNLRRISIRLTSLEPLITLTSPIDPAGHWGSALLRQSQST